jgi:hypothetical protein
LPNDTEVGLTVTDWAKAGKINEAKQASRKARTIPKGSINKNPNAVELNCQIKLPQNYPGAKMGGGSLRRKKLYLKLENRKLEIEIDF